MKLCQCIIPACILVILLFIPACAAVTFTFPLPDKTALTDGEKKFSSDLLDLVRASEGTRTAMGSDVAAGPLFGAPLEESAEDTVYVYVTVDPAASTHLIDAYASSVTGRDEEHHIAAAEVPVASLADLAALPEVVSMMRVLPPMVNAGSVETEGDTLLRAKALRNVTGYGGAGVRIGIISDGVDHIETAVSSGDLPEDVHVLSNEQGGDEGTAMLEIVHDIAPDADLYFHDHGSSWIGFNEAIDALAAAGCTVICDDIAWTTVPYFEDGIIASHIQALVDGDEIIYLSSAGNYGRAHYQGEFTEGGDGWHDFGGGNTTLPFTVPAGTSITLVFEWNDPWGFSSNDYDLYVYDASGTLISSSTGPQDGDDNPIEYVQVRNTGTRPVTAYGAVNKYSGSARTLEFFVFGASSPIDAAYGPEADSVFGHQAAEGVIAVGSIDHADAIRYYSSRGPSTISYPVAVQRGKPEISATDGVSVTGSGGFPSTFYGTSAAAPHVAAIAALVWGLAPDLSTDEVREKLLSTAVDLGTGGFDTTYGYGRVDALAFFIATGSAPTASFDAAPLSGPAPLTVNFTDTSVGATAWEWAFGDGRASTEQYPVHTYTAPGNYTVSLRASSLFGGATAERVGYIAVTKPPLAANFSANRTSGTVPFAVQFADETTGIPLAWNWSFGDGVTSTEQHPLHTYMMPGNYTVSLAVADAYGSTDTTMADGYIVADAPPLVAAFTTNVTSGFVPFAVEFNDTTAGAPVAWNWSFGDNGTSTEQHPIHAYTMPGVYTVNLTVTDAYGAVSGNESVIQAKLLLHPGFSANLTSGVVPFAVGFTDLTPENASAWLWSFGDTTTSTEQHPAHIYTTPGNYTVTLAVNGGAETCTREAYIKVTPLLFGDANDDGTVNQADTLRVLKEVVGLKEEPAAGTEQFRKTDVHANGAIEVGDALFIAQYNVGLRDAWFEIV
ncbi:MAG: PKD domain-containing protein [Methanofollis liminatans]|nr:PKD domain-containing protein [Methanofollis liminatans]